MSLKITSDGTNATVTLKDGTEVTDTIANITTTYGIEQKLISKDLLQLANN